jgi:hypothetical protein
MGVFIGNSRENYERSFLMMKNTVLKAVGKAARLPAVLLLAFGLALAGCDNPAGGGDNGGTNNGDKTIDWTDHNSGYSVQVRNQTSQRLVAFKNDVRADALLGGIPAGPTTQAHGLPKNGLFEDNAAFTLILLTEDQYNRYKDDPAGLEAQKNTPFTRIFAFYNAQGSNENAYTISGRLGGNRIISINNNTGWDVELRLNGIDGETLGYAVHGMLNTRLYVNGGEDFFLFPVMLKYNSIKQEIITVYPKGSDGTAKYDQFALTDEEPEHQVNINNDWLSGYSLSLGTAWLIVENRSGSGIQLQTGENGTVIRTSLGIATINNGSDRTFQIDMAKVPGTEKYADSRSIYGYTAGRATNQARIGGASATAENCTLQVGKIYKITVTGTPEAPVVSLPVYQSDINLDDF